MAANGQLPVSSLARIKGNGWLRKDAARAWNAMSAAAAKDGVDLSIWESSMRRTYRPFAQQVEARRHWCNRGRCGNAAVPGTSNHGLGISVDLMNWTQRRWIDRHGARYGWAKRWSDASHEWWHLKWRPGVWTAPARDPLWFLTDEERRKYREWHRLRASGKNRPRRRVLWAWFIKRRDAIHDAARKSGWNKLHRRRRYEFFNKITRS